MNLLDPDLVTKTALARGAPWTQQNGTREQFYVEGVTPDANNIGIPNDNAIDKWNDTCGIIEWQAGKPVLIFATACTTTPGIYYDREHIIGWGGRAAAIIDAGYQDCWQVGIHQAGSAGAHEALVQTGGECRVWRDIDQTLTRGQGSIQSGWFGINQHSTADYPVSDSSIGGFSAGCIVIPHMGGLGGHLRRMELIKGDPRTVANPQRKIGSIVMPAEWLAPTASISPTGQPLQVTTVATAVNADFAYCLKLVLVHEGENDDSPLDPGGRTSRGIIQTEWNTWRQTHPGLPSDVWQAPQDQVEAIYKQKYWNVLFCDGLPSGIDYAVFDYGVNSGVSRSAKLLQTILGISADGIIGKNTIAAAGLADAKSFINSFCDERLAFLQGLSTWGTFGRGWTNRVTDVRRDALAMVDNPPAKPEVITVVNPPAVVTPPVVIIPPPGPAQGGLTPAQIAQIAAVVQQMVAGAASSPKTTVVIGDLLGQLASHFPTLAALGWIVYSVLNSISTYGATPDAATAAAPAVLGGSAIVGVLLKLNQVLRGQST